MQPSFVLPTVVANWDPTIKKGGGPLDDLDYSIGHEALSKAATSSLTYPVKHGMVRSQPYQHHQEAQKHVLTDDLAYFGRNIDSHLNARWK